MGGLQLNFQDLKDLCLGTRSDSLQKYIQDQASMD